MPKSTPLNPIAKHIGARIRMRRLELRISQGDFGESLGVSFQQVQKYEKGTNQPSATRLSEIAAALGVEVGFFYVGAPGKGRPVTNGPATSTMDDFIATADGLMIAQAMIRIKSPEVRHVVAAAVAKLVGAVAP